VFGKKRTTEDVEQYISSLMLPGEAIEVLHIERAEPNVTFSVVTSHRFIATAMAGGGGLLVRSMPFDRIASVSVTTSRDEPLDYSTATGVVVYPLGSDDHIVISDDQQGAAVRGVYEALLQKLCGAGAPAMA
jgi:hypothetical protein